MKKQAGISTVTAAVIAGVAAGAAVGALAIYEGVSLMHVRSQLAETQRELQAATASGDTSRTVQLAMRKELDEQKLAFDQMRAERDSAKNLLEAEKLHAERIHGELNLAREQLAALSRPANQPPRAVAAPASRPRAAAAPVPGR